MKLIKGIIILLVLTYSFWIFQLQVLATDSLSVSDLESQITPESSELKIEKLQGFFRDLWLYNWEIDWIYKNIEWTLINYQIKSGLVSNWEDWWAWYFGRKTLNQLKIDSPLFSAVFQQ